MKILNKVARIYRKSYTNVADTGLAVLAVLGVLKEEKKMKILIIIAICMYTSRPFPLYPDAQTETLDELPHSLAFQIGWWGEKLDLFLL